MKLSGATWAAVALLVVGNGIDQIAFESQLVQAVILRRAPIRGRIKFEFTGIGEKRVCRAWARLASMCA